MVDDHTEQCWSEFLARKNQTVDKVIELIKHLKAQGGKVVLVTDRPTKEGGQLRDDYAVCVST